MQNGAKYKDGLFRDYFSEPKRLLLLVNALLNLNIRDEKEIKINTLPGIFFGKLKNDLSCMVQDKTIFITEAQSTPNPNMPARMLFYSVELLKDYLNKANRKLYGTTLVKLAAPRFFVIYNGKKDDPLYDEMSLKDAFLAESTLNLTVKIININSEKADELLEKCRPLKDYQRFLELVIKYEEDKISRADAIRAAIKYAIANDIMSNYLRAKQSEVFNMVDLEWDEKEAREYFKEEGREKGREEGQFLSLKNLMKNMNLSLEKAMEVLQIPGENRNKFQALLNA